MRNVCLCVCMYVVDSMTLSNTQAYLPHAVGKHVGHVILYPLHESDGVSVVCLCLTAESSNEVTRKCHICVCVCVCVCVCKYMWTAYAMNVSISNTVKQ